MLTSRLISTFILSLGFSTISFAMSHQAENTTPGDVLDTDTGTLEIYPIEHASFAIKVHRGADELTLVVDPAVDSVAFEPFAPADIILVTDIHGDHYDPSLINALTEAVDDLSETNTTVVVPQSVADEDTLPAFLAGNIQVLNNDEDITIDGIEISAIPMYNVDPDRNYHTKGRGNGYLLNIEGKHIYISGDTQYIEEMQALQDIDAAFIVMNLPFTMDVNEAAQAVLNFEPKIVYPYHYRNQDGSYSDIALFSDEVAVNPNIDVKLLEWYS